MAIHEEALCISCNISQVKMRKLDKPTTNEVNELKQAKRGTAKVWKELFSREMRMKIETPANFLRGLINDYSHPWIERVSRIIPTPLYEKIQPHIALAKEEVEQSHIYFIGHYDEMIEAGRATLGQMFRESDYPSEASIDSYFRCIVAVNEVPIQVPSGSLYALLNDSLEHDKEDLRKVFEAAEKAQLQSVTFACAERVTKALSAIISRVNERHSGKKINGKVPTYHDSLIGNVYDLVQILPELNLAHDPTIENLYIRLRNDLLGKLDLDGVTVHNADKIIKDKMKDMRENPTLENEVKSEAQNLLNIANSILPLENQTI